MPIDRPKQLEGIRFELTQLELTTAQLLGEMPRAAAAKVTPLFARLISILAALADLADQPREGDHGRNNG